MKHIYELTVHAWRINFFTVTELKTQLDIAKHSQDQQAHALVEKEREAVKRVQAAREEEWQKLHKVEHEK